MVLYVLNIFFAVLVTFFIKICQKHTVFFVPFTSDFADSMSIISKKTTCWVIKNLILAMFVFVKRYMKRTAPKIVFFGVWSLILRRTPSPFS